MRGDPHARAPQETAEIQLEPPLTVRYDTAYTVGLIFWLTRNRLVGSYRFLTATRR